MAVEIFNRQEKKYILDEGVYHELLERIEGRVFPDEYSRGDGFYSICNIYYDTADDRLIRKSIDRPVYKEKLRLRAYGVPEAQSQAFVEIKKKCGNIVNKRRTVMTLEQARAYLDEGVRPCGEGINSQILRETDYFIDFYGVLPKVYISYDRRAFLDREDTSFRITFDSNIRTRRTDLKLESGAYGQQLLEPGKRLMEVKISGGVPTWFGRLLSEFRLYPVSFSKYGTEYRRYIENYIKKGEKTVCLNQSSTRQTLQYHPAHQCL